MRGKRVGQIDDESRAERGLLADAGCRPEASAGGHSGYSKQESDYRYHVRMARPWRARVHEPPIGSSDRSLERCAGTSRLVGG